MDKQYSPDRPFDLKGDSADFRSKKSDVFGSLDDIEKSYQTNLAGRLEEEVERNPGGSRDEVATRFDDGGFKRPRSPGGQVQRSAYSRRREFRTKAWSRRDDFKWENETPDFKKNPAKWKRYSLEETSLCGNAQNSRVAFDMIRQLKKRREEAAGMEKETKPADLSQKVVFSKPEARTDILAKAESHGDIHRMPEFNFGSKNPGKKSQRPNLESSTTTEEHSANVQVSLEYLDDERDEHAERKDRPDAVTNREDGANPPDAEPTSSHLAEEESGQISSGDSSSITVGFKKRKGKRNIRHRQEEEQDD